MFNFLHCPLSGPVMIYISLLIISCIIEYVMNKRTLNLVLVCYQLLKPPLLGLKLCFEISKGGVRWDAEEIILLTIAI